MSFAEAQSCWLSNDGAAPAAGENVPCYPDLVGALREFVDAFAGAHPDQETIKALTQDLQSWKRNLTLFAVAEGQQPFGRQHTLPGRGQIMTPTFRVTEADSENVRGTVIFGRFFLGINGAAHGGAIQLLFDEVLGRLASFGRPRARTAYLHTDFRVITPIEVQLDVRGRVVRDEGRKQVVHGEIWHDGVLCARAEALFVYLRPGQP